MIVTHLKLKNWKNFRSVDIALGRRIFLVGPNASGKSNFLDVFRFLRDIARSEGGGLQKAVNERGGISKIRCLATQKDSNIEIEVHLAEDYDQKPIWKYALGIRQESRSYHQPYLTFEKVWKNEELILDRPDEQDKDDPLRLIQTNLEQINANVQFREIVKFFESVYYLHIVPQLLRHPEFYSGLLSREDPFGRNFLERIAKTPEKTRKSRLRKIEQTLKIAVPQLKQLNHIKDFRGIPHLEAIYEHWRAKGAKQSEDQFSDGTLRLIGFLWSMWEGESILLMEEPELSLHQRIIQQLPGLIWRIQNKKKRQIIISTHSYDLLSDKGIDGNEVITLKPDAEGTHVRLASSIKEVRDLLECGFSVAESVIPMTEPENIIQLSFFNE